jgi:peptidoglycan/xylan/chitin deacetylase (PgdA/CDA1 family)
MSGVDPAVVQAAVGGATAAGALLGVGVFHPRSSLFGPTVWRGPSTRQAVALTFDDGPDAHYTARIAEILDAHQARATFFCIGQQVEACGGLAKSLFAAGHQLENHTYSHNTLGDLFSSARLMKDLQRCQETLKAVTGKSPTYYRPAVGIRNPPVHAAARALGLTVVTWTLAARDGVFALTPGRALRLSARAEPGSILALHDGERRGSSPLREHTLRELPLLLTSLKRRGLALQTLSGLLET